MRLTALCLGAMFVCAPAVTAQYQVEDYGPSCGPVATGVVWQQGATHRFAFTISAALPRTPVLLIVGTEPTMVPLWNSGCYLLTDLAFTQEHRTNAAGVYTFSHAIPGGPGGFVGQACVQFLEVRIVGSDLLVRSTNGVRLFST